MNKSIIVITSILLSLTFTIAAFAQHERPKSRFSHRGLKLALGSGGFENEVADNMNGTLKDGEAFALKLGYGIDDRFTLWFGVLGMEHPETRMRDARGFVGGEVDVQYKFVSESRLQPYARVGIGIYGIERQQDVVFVGSGFAAALGMDFFFARHFGIGVEFQFKELDYFREFIDTPEEDFDRKLTPQRDGETRGILFTFTIQ